MIWRRPSQLFQAKLESATEKPMIKQEGLGRLDYRKKMVKKLGLGKPA
jgi:hypothetical protein